MPAPLGRFVPLLRPAPVLLLAGWVGHLASSAHVDGSNDPSGDVVGALRSQGLAAAAADVHWIDPVPGLIGSRWKRPRALLLARSDDEPSDVWLVRTRFSPEGRVLDVVEAHNLTRTSAVAERNLVTAGERAAWIIGTERSAYRIELADLAGEKLPSGDEWTFIARAQQRITNLQKTGQIAGVLRRSFKLDPAGESVRLAIDEHDLAIDADGHRIRVPFSGRNGIVGERFLREQDRQPARPGNLVTWSVDRVRELPWFGDDRMQLVKAVAFAALDRVMRIYDRIHPDDSQSEIADDLGQWSNRKAPSYADPETGWPPPPMTLVYHEALEGEGQWSSLAEDPFVLQNPGAPSTFVTGYLRTELSRGDSRIYVAVWDPRQVALHMVPGTEEPVSATGETGTGKIPRDPAILTRLVAAFNGAFQSTHGDYGMMVEGNVLVPPKPYAATVAVLKDGTIGFGTWPGDVSIGPDIDSFRQNLTPLFVDGAINPYRRSWWGGVPPTWEDETRTIRSGLCVTKEGFIAYFYGSMVDHEHLGVAMRNARCTYGIHLDMNQGHTGLEFYRVGREGELAPIARKLDAHWETEGPIDDFPGYRFRGRRLVKNMQLMHFPRYIRRGQRDFFYLTLRHVLPGEPLRTEAPAEPGEGTWAVKGLPQRGWPYAIATTWLRPDSARPETKVRIVKLDPAWLRPSTSSAPSDDARTIVTLSRRTSSGDVTLWHDGRRFVIAGVAPTPSSTLLARGMTRPPSRTRAALGIGEDGMLLYAEVMTAADPGRDGALLSKLLDAVHCSARAFLVDELPLAIGGTEDLAGHPTTIADALRLVRAEIPSVRRIFPETPVLPPQVWQPLQQQTRLFKVPEPADAAVTAASAKKPESEPATVEAARPEQKSDER